MTVQLTSGGKLVYSLTSPPPPEPDPQPATDLIAKTVHYSDRSIAVTVPFPDSIELIADVTNEMLLAPNMQGGSAKMIFGLIDAELRAYVEGFKTGQVSFSPSPKLSGLMAGRHKAVFRLNYQQDEPLHRAFLTMQRRIGQDYPIWSIRLEFSAWKAGADGLLKLSSLLAEALPLNVTKLIPAFLVSRVDAAIDCVGAEPIDLIAHIDNAGKRLTYVGDLGRPETVYLYEKKKPLKKPPGKLGIKTTGPSRLKLYERRAYQLQFHLAPPFGSCPVTRAEVQKRWTKGRPSLAKLLSIKNPFDGVRVAYAPPLGGYSRGWRQFCLAAFGAGSTAAMRAFFPGKGIADQKRYALCEGDLIDQSCWTRWADGLEITGLMSWVAPPTE